MGLISYKPTTPSFRKTVKIDRSSLFKGRPEKSLVEDLVSLKEQDWEIHSVKAYDMIPQSAHLETMVFLKPAQ